MTDDASAPRPLAADTSAVETAAALPNDETKPPSNDQEPPAKQSQLGKWIAVVAALIAAASAITSALVSAHSSVSTEHSHASAVLAERKEKNETYAKYYNSLDDLDTAEEDAADIISNYKPENLTELTAKFNEYKDKYIALLHLDGNIYLIESTEVRNTTNKLLDVHNAINDLLLTIQDAANKDTLNTADPQIADLRNKIDEAYNLNKEFGEFARKDLDNLGYGELDTSPPTHSRSLWSWHRSSCSGTTPG
jgi:hypothetical protein